MTDAKIPEELRRHAISRLSGHPIVSDVIRIATALTEAPAEVVVFDGHRASVVGAPGRSILQPRPLTGAEVRLAADGRQHHADGEESAFPILGPDRSVVGALSVGRNVGVSSPEAEALHSLARICATLVAGASSDEPLPVTLIDHLRDAVVVVDSEMIITYASQAMALQLGRNPIEVVGMHVIELIHPDDIEMAAEAMVRLTGGDQLYRITVRALRSSGEYVRLEITGRDMTADPRVGGMVLSLRNADRDLELASTLERTERLSKAVVEQLHDGIVATDSVGSPLVVNDTARAILGIDAASFMAQIRLEEMKFLDDDHRPIEPANHPVRRVLDGETIEGEPMSVLTRGEHRHLVLSGRPVIDSDGSRIGTVIGFHDVTDARRVELELEWRALHDQLTGLPNRRQLEARLVELTTAAATPDLITGCLVDIDNFKLINDTHGHRTGDAVICAVADLISDGRGTEDLVVRLGGDEFIVLFDAATPDEARETANEIRRRLTEPLSAAGQDFMLTCSIGVAQLDAASADLDALLRHTDIAMYAAKARGRNRVDLYNKEMAVAVETAVEQRDALRRALDDDALEMHFQPLVDPKSGHLIGVESLARCRAADGTLIGPESFLAAAAGSGLIWDLDRKAFDLSCRAAAQLQTAAPDLTMACNFSGLSVLRPEFVQVVMDTIRRHDLSASTMVIEITESTAFEAGPNAIEVLEQLQSLGISVALDDFGTGYSSLSHLKDLPLAMVKVDRSFVTRLTPDCQERSIAKAIVKLAEDLGLDVVAEGVETTPQLEAAQDMGFNMIQGWHYSPARSLDEILELLTAERDDGHISVPDDWHLS